MQEVLWHPDTYDFARGLALGSYSSSLLATVVEWSGGRVLPFLDPSGSPVGAAFLFLSPPAGRENFPLTPPHFRGRRAPRCYRTMSPIRPCAGDLSWSPWPSSWPSSPAPHRAPEPASPLREPLLDLRAVGPDNRSAPLLRPGPVKWHGGSDPSHDYTGERNIL